MFLFRLALQLGRTVDELLDSMTYEELLRWGEFYSIEPWGDWAHNVRNAHIVSTLANINRDAKKRSKPFSLEEFMLFKPKAIETPEEGAKIAPETVAWFFAKAANG